MTQQHRLSLPASGLLVAGFVISIVSSALVGFTALTQAPVDTSTPTPFTSATSAPPASSTATPIPAAVTPTPIPSGTSTPMSPDGTPTPPDVNTATRPPSDTPIPTEANTSTPSATSTEPITATVTPLPTLIISPTPTDTAMTTATTTTTPSPTASATTTASPASSPSVTTSPSATLDPSATASATTAAPPTVFPAETILINEIAWSGTQASAYDEWIELLNTSSQAIQLSGWRLSDGGDINISLEGTISAHGFFLLERTDDDTVSNIDADQIYAGGLNNSGENLHLLDPAGTLIDSANYPDGWPAGEAGRRISMERRGGEDLPGNWGNYSGNGGWGRDAASNPIHGTPRQTNSFFLPTITPAPTASEYPTIEPSPIAAGSVLINEIAWSGTAASSSDEWIELHNPGPEAIDLSGWTLSDGGDVHISLAGEIASFGFFLLERTDDNCVSDIDAQQIYSGNLNNSGERLFLYDAAGRLIDSANGDGGGWPAGESGSHKSMERRGGTDRSGNWGTFTGYYGRGRDAAGGSIAGTPGTTNSLFFPTPIPTWIPGKVVINEVLIRPHYDWEGKEGRSLDDEFIELYNVGPHGVDLGGFMLDDVADGGSKPYTLPDFRIPPGAFAVFFRSQTRIALNDTGDEVRLLSPSGRQLDSISYLKVRAYNLSYGRLPDGSGHLYYGLWPTPGMANVFFVENEEVTNAGFALGYVYEMRLVRLSRLPAMIRRMDLLGHLFQVQVGEDGST